MGKKSQFQISDMNTYNRICSLWQDSSNDEDEKMNVNLVIDIKLIS